MSDGRKPDPDLVICPACTHQFRAIPENVQAHIEALEAERQRWQVALEGEAEAKAALRKAHQRIEADRKAMEMALEALTHCHITSSEDVDAAIAALRERLK